MNHQLEAIYEKGMLRPLESLTLHENQQVTVLVSESIAPSGRAYHDTSYAADLRKEQQAMGRIPSIEEILQLTRRDTSSWAEAALHEREERF